MRLKSFLLWRWIVVKRRFNSLTRVKLVIVMGRGMSKSRMGIRWILISCYPKINKGY